MNLFTTPSVSEFFTTVGLIVALSAYLAVVRQSLLKNLPVVKKERTGRLTYVLLLSLLADAPLILIGVLLTYRFVFYVVPTAAPPWEKTAFYLFGWVVLVLAVFHFIEWVRTLLKLSGLRKQPEAAASLSSDLANAAEKNLEAATKLKESANTLKEGIAAVKKEEGEVSGAISRL